MGGEIFTAPGTGKYGIGQQALHGLLLRPVAD